jgi:hypothetical protein
MNRYDDASGERAAMAQTTTKYILYLVLLTLPFIMSGSMAILALLGETGITHDSSYRPGGATIALGVVAFIGFVLCVAAAVHCEHRLRGLPSGRLATEMHNANQIVSARLRIGGYSRYRQVFSYRRQSPVTLLVAGIVMVGIAGLGGWGTFVSHAAADRSSYTQQHGTSDTAVVGAVNVDKSTDRSGYTTYDSTVDVTLRTPVDGQVAAVVHVPHDVLYYRGEVISILVDPADASYAELPGQPELTSGDVAIGIGATVLATLLAVAFIIGSVRLRRRRHAYLRDDAGFREQMAWLAAPAAAGRGRHRSG